MPAVARRGDIHICPVHGKGQIITGSNTTTAEGSPVAREGDQVQCPDGSIAIILKTQACVLVDNKAMARVGDKTSHGGTITTGADTVTCADGAIQVVMGDAVQPLGDGVFRLYMNSPSIDIHKNMHFGKEESLSDLLTGIGLGVLEEIAGAALDASEVGAVEGIALNAEGARRIGSAAIKIESKIARQMSKRSWNKKDIEDVIENPHKKIPTRDTRYNPDGTRNDDPATAYFDEQGNYIVRNDNTGDIVQVSDKNDPNWKSDF